MDVPWLALVVGAILGALGAEVLRRVLQGPGMEEISRRLEVTPPPAHIWPKEAPEPEDRPEAKAVLREVPQEVLAAAGEVLVVELEALEAAPPKAWAATPEAVATETVALFQEALAGSEDRETPVMAPVTPEEAPEPLRRA